MISFSTHKACLGIGNAPGSGTLRAELGKRWCFGMKVTVNSIHATLMAVRTPLLYACTCSHVLKDMGLTAEKMAQIVTNHSSLASVRNEFPSIASCKTQICVTGNSCDNERSTILLEAARNPYCTMLCYPAIPKMRYPVWKSYSSRLFDTFGFAYLPVYRKWLRSAF